MERRFTLEQRWEILKNYFQSECCVAETVRKLKRVFGQNEAPSAPGVRKFIKKVRETGMLVDNKTYPRVPSVRTAERIAAVAQSVRDNPKISTRQRAQQLDISRTSLRRILQNDLGLFVYKDEDDDEEEKSVKKKTGRKKERVENEHSEEPPIKRRKDAVDDSAANDDVAEKQSDSNLDDSIEEDSEEGVAEEEDKLEEKQDSR